MTIDECTMLRKMSDDRFRTRVWSKSEGSYLDGVLINSQTGKVCGSDKYIREACTGWIDRKGNLIYEGDILLAGDLGHGITFLRWIVTWNPWTGSFVLKREDGLDDDFPVFATIFQEYSEVVGNIHEAAADCEVQQ